MTTIIAILIGALVLLAGIGECLRRWQYNDMLKDYDLIINSLNLISEMNEKGYKSPMLPMLILQVSEMIEKHNSTIKQFETKNKYLKELKIKEKIEDAL